ncbi:MAG: hypothetical protein RR363_04040, partial [Rikenellaceae bacterium]
MNSENGVEKIDKICSDVLKITQEDFKEALAMARDQLWYCHPFDYELVYNRHKLGEYNIKILKALQTLQD